MKIRARPDLTAARDEVATRLRELLSALETAKSLRDLERLLYALKAARCDEALAELIVAIELGAEQQKEPESVHD